MNTAFKMPHELPSEQEQRMATIHAATLHAASVPLAVAQKAVTVMALAERCAAIGNLNAISDAASAVALAQAALTSAGHNVRINVNSLGDKTDGEEFLAQVKALEARARKLQKDTHGTLARRGGISPS